LPASSDGAAADEVPGGIAVPDAVRAAARSAFATRDVGAHLLEVVSDSLDEAVAETGRTVRFAGPGLAITLATDDERLAVELSPAPSQAASVSLETPAAPALQAEPDEPGRWTLRPVPTGPVRLALSDTGLRARTAWIRL